MAGRVLILVSVALVQKCMGDSAEPLAKLGHGFNAGDLQQLSDFVSGFSSNATMAFGSQLDLFRRQTEQCDNPGYVPCPNIPDACCPPNNDCFPAGCCVSGEEPCGSSKCYNPSISQCCPDGNTACQTGYDCVQGGCCPSGEIPCGTTKCYDPNTQTCCEEGALAWGCPKSNECCGSDHCYEPDSERCCAGGSCQEDDTCCEEQCCHSIAYCADDGFCSLCPARTVFETSTYDSTTYRTVTAVITEVSEPPEADEFSCPELTVTNSVGAMLELGDDCSLTYAPPGDTSFSIPSFTTPSGSITSATRTLHAGRAVSCEPYATLTSTQYITSVVTSTYTVSSDAMEEEQSFSCPPMTVTNAAGDQLVLDGSCALEYSPAASSTSSSGGGGGGGNAAATIAPGKAIYAEIALIAAFFYLVL